MNLPANLQQIRQTLRLKPATPKEVSAFSLVYLHLLGQGLDIPTIHESSFVLEGKRQQTTFQFIKQTHTFYKSISVTPLDQINLVVAIPNPFKSHIPPFTIRPKNSLHPPTPQLQYLLANDTFFSTQLILTLEQPGAFDPFEHCSPRLWSLVQHSFNELLYTQNHLLCFVAKPSTTPTVYEMERVIRLALTARAMINGEMAEKQLTQLEPELTYTLNGFIQRQRELGWLADLFNWRYHPEQDLTKELRRLLAETTQQKAVNLVRGEFEHTSFLLFDHTLSSGLSSKEQTVVAIPGHSDLPSFQLTPAGFTTWLRQQTGSSFIQSDRLPQHWAVQTFEKELSRNQLLEKLPTSSWQKIGSRQTVVRHDGFWYVYFVPGQLQSAELLIPFVKQAVTFYKELQQFKGS